MISGVHLFKKIYSDPTYNVGMATDGEYIYAAGGYTSFDFDHIEKPKLLKLTNDQWEAISPLPTAIGEHALIGQKSELYLLGGRTQEEDSKALWKYQADNKSWERLADMPTPRHSFAWVIYADELWVTGGRSRALGTGIEIVEIYNFATNTWRTGPSLQTGRGGHFAAIQNDKLHILGGEIFEPLALLSSHEVLNLKTLTWSTRPEMPLPRHGGIAVNLNNRMYLIGGGSQPAFHTIYSADSALQILEK